MRLPVFLTTLPPAVIIPGAFPAGSPLNASLNESELHHLNAVLRLRAGDRIELSDLSHGIGVSGIIRAIDGHVVTVEVIQVFPRAATPKLTLIVGAVKAEKCELIVEKVSEIGAGRIVFFDADRSNRPISAGNKDKRHGRLVRIAEGAIKQSSGGRLPDIELCPALADALRLVHGGPQASDSTVISPASRILLVAPTDDHSQPPEPKAKTGVPSLRKLLQNSPLETSPPDVDFHLVIGPEGGFTPSEIAFVLSYGYERASLGPRVLRTETAAIVGCAAVSLGIL